jgi:chromosomal replication initiation ATPase DnaA
MVATFYGISRTRIRGKDRPAHLASEVALYFSQRTDVGLREIPQFFGGKHYTAVTRAHLRIGERRQRDSRFNQEMKSNREKHRLIRSLGESMFHVKI